MLRKYHHATPQVHATAQCTTEQKGDPRVLTQHKSRALAEISGTLLVTTYLTTLQQQESWVRRCSLLSRSLCTTRSKREDRQGGRRAQQEAGKEPFGFRIFLMQQRRLLRLRCYASALLATRDRPRAMASQVSWRTFSGFGYFFISRLLIHSQV